MPATKLNDYEDMLEKADFSNLPDSDFGLIQGKGKKKKRRYPIHDEKHVRLAWQMSDRGKDMTDDERKSLKRKILARAKKLGMDTKDWRIEKSAVQVLKIDSEKHIIKGAVYVPFEVDSQGDWATAEEVEKAAYNFMKHARVQKIDTQHDWNEVDCFVCESYLAKNDSDFPVDGTWVVAIKINSDSIWEDIEKGNIGGLSLAGVAVRYYDVDPTETA